MNNLFAKPTSSINFTAEQQAVVNSTDPVVLVNAVAGSGKTSVLMELATKYPNGLYMAFNKAIVKDVVPKLPMGWSCKTFNSFGLRMVYQNMSPIKVDFNKYSKKFGYGPAVQLAQKHMIMGGDGTLESWRETCRRFQLSTGFINAAKDTLKEGIGDTTVVSGDEMLEYPIRKGFQSDPYEVVLIDECQDLNPQQIKFLSCIPTKRIIFVGDTNQAIYGFRGSDPYAIDLIKDQYNPKQYPMNESFRCPTSIVGKVQHLVPHIFSSKVGGEVQASREVVYPHDCFILSRTNANLIKLAYQFIANEEPFSISNNFVNQLNKQLKPILAKSKDINDVHDTLEKYYAMELDKYIRNSWNPSSMIDRYKGLMIIAKRCNSVAEIKKFVNSLRIHENSSSGRKLMTIHAAKGLEHRNVYFLKPSVIKYLKDKTNNLWERQQEDNLFYVACTRSLDKLTFVE